MPKLHNPVIKGEYKVTRYTRVVLIVVEHEEDEIQWVCNMSISTDVGEPETLKEAITRPNGYLWKMSVIYEVKKYVKKGMDSDQENHIKS